MVTGPAAANATGYAANGEPPTSGNWAGYAARGRPGAFSSVATSWTQPAVTCSAQQTFSGFWVGLDGDGTKTVEQTGTAAECANGSAYYRGWFEMYPSAQVYYKNLVEPGDTMSASVVANGGGAFTLTLSDQTQGWTQTTHRTGATTAQRGSAEIIAEAPFNGKVLPLSKFGTVSFAHAVINNAPAGNARPAALTLVSPAGVTEARPSALANGQNFTVTWASSGASATGRAPGTSPAPGTSATPGASAAP